MSKNMNPISVLVGKEKPVGENIHWFSLQIKNGPHFYSGDEKKGAGFFYGPTSSDSIKYLHRKFFITEINKNSGLDKNATVLKVFPVIPLQHINGHKIFSWNRNGYYFSFQKKLMVKQVLSNLIVSKIL